MYVFRLKVALFLMAFSYFSCGGDEEELIVCNETPIIDSGRYSEEANTSITITQASLLTGCLELRFSYTGCSPDAPTVFIVDEHIEQTYPPVRRARLQVEGPVDCSVSYTSVMRIDISPLQVGDVNQINLELEGFDTTFTYSY